MSKPIDLQTRFHKEILPELKKSLNIKNENAVPKIQKVNISVGIGSYVKTHGKDFSNVVENVTKISGQKPVVTKARLAISNFKIRIGDPVGVSVTLRGKRMYDFLNKLINIVFPRVRDFRGISPKAFDRNGNCNIGFNEQTIFPEISPDDISKNHGIQINIVTTARNNEEGFELLKALGFPFRKN